MTDLEAWSKFQTRLKHYLDADNHVGHLYRSTQNTGVVVLVVASIPPDRTGRTRLVVEIVEFPKRPTFIGRERVFLYSTLVERYRRVPS